jgi:hypothetical protein
MQSRNTIHAGESSGIFFVVIFSTFILIYMMYFDSFFSYASSFMVTMIATTFPIDTISIVFILIVQVQNFRFFFILARRNCYCSAVLMFFGVVILEPCLITTIVVIVLCATSLILLILSMMMRRDVVSTPNGWCPRRFC